MMPTRVHNLTEEMQRTYMQAALGMAEAALDCDETPVGCVFVHQDQIVAKGMNDTNRSLNGTRHAELVALEMLLSGHSPSILAETDLYVTVEPCIMCASALRQYGIRAVYYGCTNDKFGGTGGVLDIHSDDDLMSRFSPSSDRPLSVHGGIFREEAIMLLRRFYVQENKKAPEPMRKGPRELKTEVLSISPDVNTVPSP